MFTKVDSKPKSKTLKYTVGLFLAATACVTIGLIGFGGQQEDLSHAAMDSYVNNLVDHHEFATGIVSATDKMIS